MGIWKKSPQVDPAIIAQLQARVDADPSVQNFTGWRRNASAGGRVDNPDALSVHIKALLGNQLPDGYDVSQDGQIVYTNKTPALQQAAWAALPIAGVSALGAALPSAAGAGAAGVNSAIPLGEIPAAGSAGLYTAGQLGGAGLTGVDLASKAINGAKAGSDVLNGLTSAKGIASLASMIPMILAAQSSNSDKNNPLNNPQIQQLLNMSLQRQQRTDPLHQAVTQLSMSMLPTAVQK